MNFNNYIEDLSVKFGKNKLIKYIMSPLYTLWRRHHGSNNEVNRLRDNFIKNGLNVLEKFDEAMTKNGYAYSLAFGTLLGAVREHGFIKHDFDIDVFVWIDDYDTKMLEVLKEHGFELTHQYYINDGIDGKEDCVMLNDVKIDIFYYYPPLQTRNNPYCCDFRVFDDCRFRQQSIRKHGGFQPYRLEIPLSKNIIRVEFEHLLLPIPSNADEFLSCRYGKDYMIPNPQWVSNNKDEFIIPWKGKLGVYKEYIK